MLLSPYTDKSEGEHKIIARRLPPWPSHPLVALELDNLQLRRSILKSDYKTVQKLNISISGKRIEQENSHRYLQSELYAGIWVIEKFRCTFSKDGFFCDEIVEFTRNGE